MTILEEAQELILAQTPQLAVKYADALLDSVEWDASATGNPISAASLSRRHSIDVDTLAAQKIILGKGEAYQLVRDIGQRPSELSFRKRLSEKALMRKFGERSVLVHARRIYVTYGEVLCFIGFGVGVDASSTFVEKINKLREGLGGT